MPSPLTKKCRGLYTSGNRYDVPEGALVQAANILITRDGVIQPRWGLSSSISNTAIGNVSHWHRTQAQGTTLWGFGRDTGTNLYAVAYASLPSPSSFTSFATGEDSPDGGANFTSSSYGLYYDIETFSNRGNLYANLTRGLIRYESTSTSRRVGNFPCAVSCFPRHLTASLSKANGVSIVTATTVFPHGYVVGMKVSLTSAGDANFTNGDFTVLTVPTTFTFTYDDSNVNTSGGTETLAAQTVASTNLVGTSGFMAANDRVAYRALLTEFDTAGNEYIGEVSSRIVVTNGSPFVGTAADKNVQIAVLFPPASLAANTKLEVYRSAKAASLEPSDSLSLVYTKYLKSDEISQGYCWITDSCPDLQRGKALYINEDQDGLLQNNLRPAACKTVAKWGERVVQANTFDHPGLEMQLIGAGTSPGLAAGDYFNVITNGAITSPLSYNAVASGTGYNTSFQFSVFTSGTADINAKNTVLSLVDTINWNGGTTSLNISPLTTYNAVWTSLPTDWLGRFAVRRTTPDQNEITSTTGQGRTVTASTTGTSSRGAFAPKLAAIHAITDADRASNVVTITTSSNHNFEVGEFVSIYNSGNLVTVATDSNGVAVEGQVLTTPTATTLTISNTGDDLSNIFAGGLCATKYRPTFNPNHQVDQIRVSKPGQPEGFPAFNTLKIGSPGFKILKCVECQDSLLVFKEDGLFRVSAAGVFGEQLSAEKLDSTAILWAKDSAVNCGDKVIAWLTKGVALIGERGVEKYISEGRVEDKLPPVDGANAYPLSQYPFSQRAVGVFDTAKSLYELRIHFGTTSPYASTVNLIYNLENDTWVEDDLSVVSETIYNGLRYIQSGTVLYKEQTSVNAGTSSAVFDLSASTLTSTAEVWTFTYTGSPSIGTAVTGATFYGYVLSASGGNGTIYFPGTTSSNQAAIRSDSYDFTNPVVSTVKWAPITLTEENKLKHFAEAQFMFGGRPDFVAELSTSSELVSTEETLTCKLGSRVTNSVMTYAPYNLRVIVPQQHRIGQQLSLKLVVRTSSGGWQLFGMGVSGRTIGPRVNR